MTTLVITPGRNQRSDAVFYLLVLDTGEFLYSHVCSHYGFAKGDLYEQRPERKKELKKRFGKVKINFLEDTEVSEEELLRRNREFYKNKEKQ